jgi:hypothetical protein
MYLSYRAYRSIQIYRKQRIGVTPIQAFNLCHTLLQKIVLDAWELLPEIDSRPPVLWDQFTVSADGLVIRPVDSLPSQALISLTEWVNVSGVGLEMRPLYDYFAPIRSYWDSATRINTGYQFNLVVVPRSGNTLNITIPLKNNTDAVQFAAHVLAFARSRKCRLSVMGFDKAMTQGIVHLQGF